MTRLSLSGLCEIAIPPRAYLRHTLRCFRLERARPDSGLLRLRTGSQGKESFGIPPERVGHFLPSVIGCIGYRPARFWVRSGQRRFQRDSGHWKADAGTFLAPSSELVRIAKQWSFIGDLGERGHDRCGPTARSMGFAAAAVARGTTCEEALE